MKARLASLGRLAELRARQVRQVMARVHYQQQLCQRYRSNIAALEQLCGFTSVASTALQRSNEHQYKYTLHQMLGLQTRELSVAELNLRHIGEQLQAALRHERVVTQLIDTRLREWQDTLGRQEQTLQDSLGQQMWWRQQFSSGA